MLRKNRKSTDCTVTSHCLLLQWGFAYQVIRSDTGVHYTRGWFACHIHRVNPHPVTPSCSLRDRQVIQATKGTMLPICSEQLCQFFSKARFPSILFLGVIYVSYVLLGGLVFWKLEGWHVLQQIETLKDERTKLLAKYPCVGQSGLRELAEVWLGFSITIPLCSFFL